MSWLKKIAELQKTEICEEDLKVFERNKIGRKAHTASLEKHISQLSCIAENLYFLACFDAGNEVDKIVSNLQELLSLTKLQTHTGDIKNGNTRNINSEEAQGAKIYKLPQKRPA